MHRAGKVQYRWSRLNSNVRHRWNSLAAPPKSAPDGVNLNSHDAASREKTATRGGASPRINTIGAAPFSTCAATTTKTLTPVLLRHTKLRGKQWLPVSLSGRRGQRPGVSTVLPRRLECVARHGLQRGAGSLRCSPQELRGPWQVHLRRAPPGRCLTLRSRRGPTAGHQARATGTVYIFCVPGLAPHRWSRLTSNVRPRNRNRAVRQQNQRLSA